MYGVKSVNIFSSLELTLGELKATEGDPLQKKLIENLQLNKSINELNKHCPKLSKNFLHLLSDYQIQELDYSKLSEQQLEDIFCSSEFDENEEAHKIALILFHAVKFILKIASRSFLNSLTQKQILVLEIASLEDEQIDIVI